MTRRLTPARAAMAAAPIALALTIAACGSSSSNNNTSAGAYRAPAAATAASKPAAPTAKIGVGHTKLGDVLVDGQGRTLYVFAQDTGMTSTCNGECATDWPPVTSGASPKAGAGVSAAKLGTSKRADGAMQVTWAGHPLYRFSGDQSAGPTAGQGLNEFGGVWHVVKVSSAHARTKQHKQTAASSAAPARHAATQAAAPVTPMPVHRAPAPMHSAAPSMSTSGIPQNNGGDMDSDNNGGPSDGDGNI